MLYLDALNGKTVERVPIWLMRQAGRHLPEYRALRAKTPDFLTFCKTPELCCEATLQPIERYGLDASIIFSDILTIPDAWDMGLSFVKGVGPVFETPLQHEDQFQKFPTICVEEALQYVANAIRATRASLPVDVPLIGFSGSPWTLACYMTEGRGSRTFSMTKRLRYAHPEWIQALLAHLTQQIMDYLVMQVQAGAQALMIFDTWGGLLSEKDYEPFSASWMQKIITALKSNPLTQHTPVTVFTKGGGGWLPAQLKTGADALGLDWTVDLAQAQAFTQQKVTLQGNLDPGVLYGSHQMIEKTVSEQLSSIDAKHRFVFNLGHGVWPDIEPEKVKTLVDVVHAF